MHCRIAAAAAAIGACIISVLRDALSCLSMLMVYYQTDVASAAATWCRLSSLQVACVLKQP